MTVFFIEPSASLQLDGIYEYTADRWGTEQADAYVEGLFAFFGQVAERAVTWRVIPAEFAVIGYIGKYKNHFIYWKELGSGDIGIAAILHERMHQMDRIRALFEN